MLRREVNMAGPLYAGQYGPDGLRSANGRPARNVAVTVLTTDGELATLYDSKLKLRLDRNPTSTDEDGNLRFFAKPGEYALLVLDEIFPIIVNIHPEDPAIGAWEGEQQHPVVDWFRGEGDPRDPSTPIVIGAGPGDMYRDDETGDLYQLR